MIIQISGTVGSGAKTEEETDYATIQLYGPEGLSYQIEVKLTDGKTKTVYIKVGREYKWFFGRNKWVKNEPIPSEHISND